MSFKLRTQSGCFVLSLINKFLLTMSAIWLAACDMTRAPMTTINSVTNWGTDINRVYLITTIVVSLVGVTVAVLLVLAIYKFREKPGDTTIPKQITGNHKLELLWTIIPVILLMFIVIPTWEVIFKYRVETVPADSMIVEVVGHQWWWEFRYPNHDIVTASEVHLPENTNIRFVISSADVIHSFWVPRFGGKVDALPGKDAQNYMMLKTPPAVADGGDYYQGQCVELCGTSHSQMRFHAVVHKKDEWERWVKTHNTPPSIDTSKEKRGSELMAEKACIGCHAIYGTTNVGVIGPNLTNFGNRRTVAAERFHNTQEGLAEWLRDPPKAKEGSLMLNLQLTEDEISDLSAFLRNSTIKKY
jgi:cytochrome c oxidase subunit 2